MTEDNYIMWLNSFTHIPTLSRVSVYEYFQSAENVWTAKITELEEVPGITHGICEKIIKSKDMSLIDKTLEFLEKYKTKYITVNNPVYPRNLKNIPDYPLGFFMYGEMPDPTLKKAAVVGTRNADDYGKLNALSISKELASKGIVIVSGMASGIDSCAHKGALDANGKTIAVLGCGIDITYPKYHRNLEIQIAKHGCIITEYPPKTRPYGSNFPVRNRIISGMSDAVLIIEAPNKSGAIITAELSIEYGKTVFSLPGNITNPNCTGTNRLIRDGAIPLLSSEDVLFELGMNTNKKEKSDKAEVSVPTDPKCAEILKYIGNEPISLDDISLKSKIPVSELNSSLLMLELDGFIEKISANRFINKNKS